MSLRDATIDLAPFTVFIGTNASGKSATFKALVALSKLLSASPVRGDKGVFTLDEGVTLDDLVWKGNSGLPIEFHVWLDGNDSDDPDYSLVLSKHEAGWGVSYERYRAGDGWIERDETTPFEFPTEYRGSIPAHAASTLRYQVQRYQNDSAAWPAIAPILSVADQIGSTWRYRPSANDIARFVQPQGVKERRASVVAANGFGLARVLQELQGENRATFTKIEDGLHRLFPHIRTIGFKSDYQGVRITYMTDRSEDPIPAPQEADGVLLSTFLLWRLHTAGASLRVCLEEPENGIHPSLINDRLQLLRDFAEPPDESRPPLQILVATQSKGLANSLRDRNFSSVRLVAFNPDGGTSVRKPTTWDEVSPMVNRM